MEENEEEEQSFTTMETVDFHTLEYHTEGSAETRDFDNDDEDDEDPGDAIGVSSTETTDVDDARLNEIRDMTSQYLEGQVSFTEFAAILETLGDPSLAAVTTEEAVASKAASSRQAGDALRKNQKHSSMQQDSDEVDIQIEKKLAKVRGEFYRSGNNPSVFTTRRRRKMSPTIQGMMGEAHLRFARGDLENAIDICLEIIKEQPTYVEPFHTLAMVYENQGKMKRSLQFALIAAFLDPKHCQDWPRLAELSLEENNVQQAIMCYSKASAVSPLNVDIHLRKAELCMQVEDYKGALKSFHKILSIQKDDGKLCIEIHKKIARIYHDQDELEKALESLMDACRDFPSFITQMELNLILELCLTLKNYLEALNVLISFGGITFRPPLPPDALDSRANAVYALGDTKMLCIVPKDLHRDLVHKLVIVFVQLEAFHFANAIVEDLRANVKVSDFGEQYFEIAEAYMSKKKNSFALKLLIPLIKSEKYSQAAIWLRYAECLFLLDKIEESAKAYQKVISLAPNHKIAKLNLSIILQNLGNYEHALQTLSQDEMEDLIDHDLLIERCHILYKQDMFPEFFATAMELFSRHCPYIRSREEASTIIMAGGTFQQLEMLHDLRRKRGEKLEDDLPRFLEKPSESKPEWKIYLSLCRMLLDYGRYDLLSRVTYTAWASTLFISNEAMQRDLEFHSLYAALLNTDMELAPVHLRGIFFRFPLSQLMINILVLAMRQCDHSRYKLVNRLIAKYPSDNRLKLLAAHSNFMTGNYKVALLQYYSLSKLNPKESVIPLMISTTLLHMSAQKTATNKTQMAIQAIAFMNQYLRLRGDCQESNYNMGRALHFLGLYQVALTFYKKVLMLAPVLSKNPKVVDLSREAAFNISQIYKVSGCQELARLYVHKYISM